MRSDGNLSFLNWLSIIPALACFDDGFWAKLLPGALVRNDPNATSRFAENPFSDKPPRYIRAVRYQYNFAKPDNPEALWWNRKQIDMWIPALSPIDPRLIALLKQAGWTK